MAKQKKEKSIEETLWDSANKLRGTVEPSEYKHVVLGLIFLKFASDKFEERKKFGNGFRDNRFNDRKESGFRKSDERKKNFGDGN